MRPVPYITSFAVESKVKIFFGMKLIALIYFNGWKKFSSKPTPPVMPGHFFPTIFTFCLERAMPLLQR
jgi:hypothetical protein